jgi:hypothetical protein
MILVVLGAVKVCLGGLWDRERRRLEREREMDLRDGFWIYFEGIANLVQEAPQKFQGAFGKHVNLGGEALEIHSRVGGLGGYFISSLILSSIYD